MFAIGKLDSVLLRGNVQGVVCQGTPTRGEKQERVGTGLARSAGKPAQQRINHLPSLCFKPLSFSQALLLILASSAMFNQRIRNCISWDISVPPFAFRKKILFQSLFCLHLIFATTSGNSKQILFSLLCKRFKMYNFI